MKRIQTKYKDTQDVVQRQEFACRSTPHHARKAAHSGHVWYLRTASDSKASKRLGSNEKSMRFDSLDKVSNVVWQLLNDSVVEALNVLQQPLVILDDKVDGDTLAAKPS